MTDQEYFALDAISQSSIKDFIENRKNYEYVHVKKLGEGKSTKALELGTLNHCLLFESDEFHNRYAHFSGEVPNSPQAWKFYDLCFGERNMDEADAYVNSYSCKSKTQQAITKESNDLFNKYEPYAIFMRTNSHKCLITPEQELESRRMVEEVLTHPGVIKTLVAGRVNPNYDIHKELVITLENPLVNRIVKLKIDEVHVDVKNQIVYAYDYKTTRNKNTESFKGSAKFYGYDIQESFYEFHLRQWLKETLGLDFQIVFRFIPQLSIAPYNVLDVIEFDADDREQAYMKWSTAIKELSECLETGQFDNPAAYTESGVNKVKLNKENIYILEEATAF